MRLLLYSGVLYLIGIAIVLALKPNLMFREDGGWKEFGIGRNSDRYTWFPFWLFAIMWAIFSYFMIIVMAKFGLLPGIDLKSNGNLNNSRNLSNNLYKSQGTQGRLTTEEMLPVVDEEDFFEEGDDIGNDEIHVQQDTPYVSELDSSIGKEGDVGDLGDLEVTSSKSRSRSTGTRNLQRARGPTNLKRGYYILNTNATRNNGAPRYIYLGPEAPRMVYK